MEDHPPSIPTAAMTGASEPDGSPSTAQLPRTFPPQQEVKPPSLQAGLAASGLVIQVHFSSRNGMNSLAKPHPRTTRVWGRCALEAISCGKCHGSVPSPFPGGCQIVPTLVRHVPLRSDLASSCWKAHGWLVWAGHENDGPCVTRCVHMWCSQRWETTRLLPGLQGHSLRQPTINPASSLFPPSVQVLPVVAAPASARLVLSQHDWERMTDRLLPFPARANTARGRGKERSRWRWEPGACVSSLAARTSSRLCWSRTCPVRLLAVHTASAQEAGYGGSFHERPHTLLQLYGAVPSAPPHDTPRSASGKQEDRMLAALALAAAA